MPTKTYAGIQVELDNEGYLKNPNDWTEQMASELAREVGIESLTEGHWKVIRFLRDDFKQTGQISSLRRIKNFSGVGIKELYELFPDGPGKKAARAAGLSKPDGCV